MSQETANNKPPRPQYKSYGEIVWGQFQKYPTSLVSLYGIGILFLVATYAPVFAANVPFYISVPEGVGPATAQGVHFPWFAALFDANFYESGVDIFFNVLVFGLPLAFGGWFLFKKFAADTTDKKVYRRQRRNYGMIAALVLLVVCIVVFMSGFSLPYVDYVGLSEMDGVSAIFPPVEYSYRDIDLQAVQQDPSWTHWLGTDRKGRDVFTRLLYGTRISLTIGVVAVGIYVTIGAILGSLAGYFGGKIDSVILRMIEVMLCFPTFFLILTIRGFIDDPSIFHIMVIIGLTGWTKVARLVRGEFLRLKNQEFVQAAKAMGLKQGRIIFRHILPNSLGPVLVAATFGVAGAILIEASLSFLGLGPPTAPSWGQILTTGRETGQMALILAPGFAIFVTVSLLNLVGEGVRDAIDPKLRK
ncbi:ABC transporter permease [Persicimonas caeni]|nr:ABC transporter permease [Persicimonas caeni]